MDYVRRPQLIIGQVFAMWELTKKETCARRHHSRPYSLKGWQLENKEAKMLYHQTFRDTLGRGDVDSLQEALKKAIELAPFSTGASRRSEIVQEPLELVEQRALVRHNPGDREAQKTLTELCRKWWARKAALALDRSVLVGSLHKGKSRRLLSKIHIDN